MSSWLTLHPGPCYLRVRWCPVTWQSCELACLVEEAEELLVGSAGGVLTCSEQEHLPVKAVCMSQQSSHMNEGVKGTYFQL